MKIEDLLEKMKVAAYDPELATDEGHGIVDQHAKPILYIANPPAGIGYIVAAEQELSFGLPPLLKALYTQVGNGGYGPGYGLWGVRTKLLEPVTVQSEYAERSSVVLQFPEWIWPRGLLPICDWGDGILSCIDCTRNDFPVIRYQPEAAYRSVCKIDLIYEYGGSNLQTECCTAQPEWDLPNYVGLEYENRILSDWLEAWLEDIDLFDVSYV